jgi:hypothetical protein
MNALFSLDGRTALVTGGSRGIGRMIAAGFLRAGCRAVYISSRKADACDATARELSSLGTCVSLPADVSDVQGVQALVAAFGEREQALDILVNNAGAAWGESFDTFPEKGWDKVVDLNLKTPFFLTQALAAPLRKAASAERPAKVINIASIDGISVNPLETYSYTASKGRADPADAADGAAARTRAHRRQRDRSRRVRFRDEPRRSRPRRGGEKAHPGWPDRRRRRHGRGGDLPGVARRRLRRRLDPRRRRRRVARPRMTLLRCLLLDRLLISVC